MPTALDGFAATLVLAVDQGGTRWKESKTMIQECIHCGKRFNSNPRVKNQMYCAHRDCQRARRARWQRKKMARDPDYRENQNLCWKQWQETHPDYWMAYRARHPEYAERNRLLQIVRNARKRKDRVSKVIAKMDSLAGVLCRRRGEVFRLVPQDDRLIAKMDSLLIKLFPIQALRRL